VVVQLKNFVKLVARKVSQHESHDKMIVASCHRKGFESLLKLLMAGVTVTHDDLHVVSFASECCTSLLLLLLLLMILWMFVKCHCSHLCDLTETYTSLS